MEGLGVLPSQSEPEKFRGLGGLGFRGLGV